MNMINEIREHEGIIMEEVMAAAVDAFYQETDDLLAEWRDEGASIVNLETSAFYAVSLNCGVKSLWLGFVSDCLVSDEWDDWHIDLTEQGKRTAQICYLLSGRIADQSEVQ